MGKQMQPNIKTKYLLDASNEFYQDLLGYKPETTKLSVVNNREWNSFCQNTGQPKEMNGIYIPRSETAIVRNDVPYKELGLFHEFYGHGLFCERTLLGKKLVGLDKKLMEEEKSYFTNNSLTRSSHNEFVNNNETARDLVELKNKTETYQELWSIFTEYLLGEEVGIRGFLGKYKNLSGIGRQELDKFISFKETFGKLAIHYANGFEKKYTPKKVKGLMKDLYNGKSEGTKLSVLYGSKKPHSDIDIFSISNSLPTIDEDWIDSRVISPEDFERRINLFDICVTDPILTGEYVLGDRDYFEMIKKRLMTQPITQEAIEHNLNYAKTQKQIASKFPLGSFDNKKHLGYARTLLLNALSLKEGKRLLTKNSYSLSENFIQLKGGIKT